ncbi:MAG: MaoC family dehydratase N-terminal domain-containing protein [Chloroflexi bacterium]|nr:MaoC family dehydratase N-terminal domain-containing protein [Chloroflexota bacterium]
MSIQPPLITPEIRQAIGVESEPRTHEVEKGAIRRFAEAIEDPNPLYTDEVAARRSPYGGITAPPTFLRSLAPGPAPSPVRAELGRRLDGGSEWEYFEPVRPGDRITVTGRLVDASERTGSVGRMLLLTNELRYVNQFGQLVAVQRNTLILY